MRGLFTNRMISLQPGQVISGVVRHVQTLRIARGRVWITVEGIKHDYFLHAGDTFTLIPGRLTVLEADHAADVDFRRPHPAPLRTIRGVWRLLADLPHRLGNGATVKGSAGRHCVCNEAC